MKVNRNALSHPAFFNRYVEMVGEDSIIESLVNSLEKMKSDMYVIGNVNFDYAYAENKWTIKTLIRHCIDAEIIFMSRALSIARNDKNPIRSFDENAYAKESIAGYQKEELIEEFLHARKATVLLFKGFKEEWLLSNIGITEKGDTISLLSIAYIIIGHWLHHKKILTEKYGIVFNQ
jgi:hypothetical protein